MKKVFGLLSLFLLVGFGAEGCAFVTSANSGMSSATGEAWYTKDKFFLVFPLGTDVYYCPSAGSACYKAKIQ